MSIYRCTFAAPHTYTVTRIYTQPYTIQTVTFDIAAAKCKMKNLIHLKIIIFDRSKDSFKFKIITACHPNDFDTEMYVSIVTKIKYYRTAIIFAPRSHYTTVRV